MIFHSDRGCQRTSREFADLATDYDIALSLGRTGQCWDNALAESFVQRFREGEAAPMPSTAFEVLRRHVDGTQPEHDFWHLRATDGGEAEIYAPMAPETFDSSR